MNPYVKKFFFKYARNFTLYYLSIELLLILFKIITGEKINFYIVLFTFIAFVLAGIIQAALVIYFTLRNLKKAGVKEITEEILSATHKRIIKSKYNLIEIYDRLKNHPDFSDEKILLLDEKIIIKKYRGLSPIPIIFVIRLLEKTADYYIYELTVEPEAQSFLYYDSGKNYLDLMKLEKMLTQAD